MRKRPGSEGMTVGGPGCADSDAVLIGILAALVAVCGLALVVGVANAPSVPEPIARMADQRTEPPVSTAPGAGASLRVALLGDGPVPMAAIAPAGALDEAAGVRIATSARSSRFVVTIATTDTDWLSVPEPTDYRRASGRPSASRYRDTEAPRMPGLMNPSASYTGPETPSIVPIGALPAVPSWLAPLPLPIDPSRAASASFGPET